MRELWVAIIICWGTADVVINAFPIGSVVAQAIPVRAVMVMVCEPKDQGRIVPGMIIPRLVKTERFVAASMSPVAQAAEQRGKRKR